MDNPIKLVLTAKLEGAQFLCSKCKKVFISEKHLKNHENRRHSLIYENSIRSMRPSERIRNLVEFLSLKDDNGTFQMVKNKEPNGEPHRLTEPLIKQGTQRITNNSAAQTSMRETNLGTLDESVPTDIAATDSQFTRKSTLSLSSVDKCNNGAFTTNQAEDSNFRRASKNGFGNQDDRPGEGGVFQMSETGSNELDSLDIWDDDRTKIILKFVQLNKEELSVDADFATQLDGFMQNVPNRNRTKSERRSFPTNSIFSFHDSNQDNWLMEDLSSSESSSNSAEDDSHAKPVELGQKDTANHPQREIESVRGRIAMDLQKHLKELGIDPGSKGVEQKTFEKARIALHSKRAIMAQETDNFMIVLDELKNRISNQISEGVDRHNKGLKN